jgi:[ribosomal protein S18]-alanine N-acetyltransferase
MPAFALRAYEPADFEALYVIDQACYPRGIAYSRRTLRSFLGEPESSCLVAETEVPAGASGATGTQKSAAAPAGREIAGFLIAEAAGGEAHIITIDVQAKYRRAGVGSVLLRETERQLHGRGVRRITLETATSNQAAVAFWQRHGYRYEGLLRGYYLGRLDAYWMVKQLPTVMPPVRAPGIVPVGED